MNFRSFSSNTRQGITLDEISHSNVIPWRVLDEKLRKCIPYFVRYLSSVPPTIYLFNAEWAGTDLKKLSNGNFKIKIGKVKKISHENKNTPHF